MKNPLRSSSSSNNRRSQRGYRRRPPQTRPVVRGRGVLFLWFLVLFHSFVGYFSLRYSGNLKRTVDPCMLISEHIGMLSRAIENSPLPTP